MIQELGAGPRSGQPPRLYKGWQTALKALVLKGPKLGRDSCVGWRIRDLRGLSSATTARAGWRACSRLDLSRQKARCRPVGQKGRVTHVWDQKGVPSWHHPAGTHAVVVLDQVGWHMSTAVAPRTPAAPPRWPTGDKAYGYEPLYAYLQRRGIGVVIPQRSGPRSGARACRSIHDPRCGSSYRGALPWNGQSAGWKAAAPSLPATTPRDRTPRRAGESLVHLPLYSPELSVGIRRAARGPAVPWRRAWPPQSPQVRQWCRPRPRHGRGGPR